MKLLVSACLMGMYCRYDGKATPLPQLSRLLEEYSCIPVCPELFGGLPTPRVPAERRQDRIINKNGEDVTEAYVRGAAETLRLAKLCDCGAALLKERSPSCGCGAIYDGTFSGRLVKGDGLAAQTLKRYGIPVYGESQIEALLPEDDLIFGTMMGFREELREEERAAIQAAREAAAAKAKAEAEAARLEAEAAAAAAAKAEEEAAAAKAAEDAAVAAALAEDDFKPFGNFSMGGGGAYDFASDDSNPFAELLKLGSLEQFSKPEPITAAETDGLENVVFLTNPAGAADSDENPFAAFMKPAAETEGAEGPAEDGNSDENPFAAFMKSAKEQTAPAETAGQEPPAEDGNSDENPFAAFMKPAAKAEEPSAPAETDETPE